MNKQEIFETVARHLFTQGHQARSSGHQARSSGENIVCVYRDGRGGKCAAGCLIPDNLYDEVMEGNNADNIQSILRELGREPMPPWWDENINLIQILQSVHDADHNWLDAERMRQALRGVAAEYGLDGTIVNGLAFKH